MALDPEERRRRKAEYQRQYRERNRARCAEQTRQWVERNRDRHRAYHAAYYRANKIRWQISDLARKYGITVEQYLEMVESQGGVCVGCGRSPEEAHGDGYPLHVDHDHETGTVRELLCRSCNLTLGQSGDDPERLRRLADYVERHRAR